MHPRDGPDYHLTTMFGTIYFKEERVKMPPTWDPYGPPSLPGLRSDLLLGLPNPKVSLSNFSAFPHGFTLVSTRKKHTFFSINKKNKQKTHLQLVKLPSRQILFEYPKIHLAVRLKASDLTSHRPAKMERSKSSKRVVL